MRTHSKLIIQFWKGLSVYWRAQIIGWSLLAIVATIERYLLYQSFPKSITLTLFVTPLMMILSEAMRRVYIRTEVTRGIDFVSICLITTSSLFAGLFSTLAVFFIFHLNNWPIPSWMTPGRIAIPVTQKNF